MANYKRFVWTIIHKLISQHDSAAFCCPLVSQFAPGVGPAHNISFLLLTIWCWWAVSYYGCSGVQHTAFWPRTPAKWAVTRHCLWMFVSEHRGSASHLVQGTFRSMTLSSSPKVGIKHPVPFQEQCQVIPDRAFICHKHFAAWAHSPLHGLLWRSVSGEISVQGCGWSLWGSGQSDPCQSSLALPGATVSSGCHCCCRICTPLSTVPACKGG